MGVAYLGEKPGSPRGSMGTEEWGQRAYTREFLVLASSHAVGSAEVLRCPGLPKLYTPYVFGSERDAYALARSTDAARLADNSLHWVVTVEYRTFSKQELLGAYDNPLLQVPDVQTSIEKFQEPVYAVYDVVKQELTPCRNSAGQVFDPPPMRDANRLTLTIVRNEAISVLHPSVDLIYTDAVNADVWWGCQPGTWKCQGVSTHRELKVLQSGRNFFYLRCTYKFEARPTWDTRLLDAGAYYFKAVSSTSVGAPDKFGPGEAAITPNSMTGIVVGSYIQMDSGIAAKQEYVKVTAVTGTTFTATFRHAHGPGGVAMALVRRLTFTADDGTPRVGLLDGNGAELADGKNPIFVPFRFYRRVPFSKLRLPQTFSSVA